MDKRAATTIDIVAREFIPNDDLPTIYNGMPLRTEFRAFVNFTTGELYGTVPYWNSDYVEQVLDMTFKGATQYDSEFIADQMQHDLNTFRRHRYNIDKDFDESIN